MTAGSQLTDQPFVLVCLDVDCNDGNIIMPIRGSETQFETVLKCHFVFICVFRFE